MFLLLPPFSVIATRCFFSFQIGPLPYVIVLIIHSQDWRPDGRRSDQEPTTRAGYAHKPGSTSPFQRLPKWPIFWGSERGAAGPGACCNNPEVRLPFGARRSGPYCGTGSERVCMLKIRRRCIFRQGMDGAEKALLTKGRLREERENFFYFFHATMPSTTTYTRTSVH